jgi:hypothetical protein
MRFARLNEGQLLAQGGHSWFGDKLVSEALPWPVDATHLQHDEPKLLTSLL